MRLNKLFLLAVTALIIGMSSISMASGTPEKPVMIIRFNEEFVNYEQPLRKVIDSALSVKPSVFFDIVSIVPDTGSNKQNKQLRKESEYLTGQVVANLTSNGIAEDKVRVTYQTSTALKDNEVQIFAR